MAELPIKMQGILYAVTDGAIEYLLIKRTPEDGDFWQPVTGTVDDGEKLVDCLIREVQEETGITKLEDVSECLYKFDWRRSSGECILEFVHAIRISRDSKVVLSPTEHEDFKWCSYDEAQQTLSKDNNKKSFQVINDHLQQSLAQ